MSIKIIGQGEFEYRTDNVKASVGFFVTEEMVPWLEHLASLSDTFIEDFSCNQLPNESTKLFAQLLLERMCIAEKSDLTDQQD